MTVEPRNSGPVDVLVGARVRAVRRSQRLSQQALAERLGLSYQQVQKYERGSNRISASMLVAIAETLGLNPGDLLGGLGPETASLDLRLFDAAGARELLTAYGRLPEHHQRLILQMVKGLAETAHA